MDKRDRIIRILTALRAKFAEGSNCTVEEADAALKRYNKLMVEYNLTETDLHIKKEGVGVDSHQYRTSGKQRPEIVWLLRPISMLTETRCLWNPFSNKIHVVGTKVDRDYAEFLIRVCDHTIETSWNAYKHSWDYTLANKKKHGRTIRHEFRMAVVMRLNERIQLLAMQNRDQEPSQTTALMILKQHLVQAFMDNSGAQTEQKGLALKLERTHTV